MVKSLIKRVKVLDTNNSIQYSFNKVKEIYADYNREQLFYGYNKDGERLRKYRTLKYARMKSGLNPLPGLRNPDLFLSGKFHKGIKMTVIGDSLRVRSSDKKNNFLMARYKKIFGLGGRFRKRFIKDDLSPVFMKRQRSKLLL
jgi:hypothetical protein